MKNSGQKAFLGITLLMIFMTGSLSSVFSKSEETEKTKFLILLEKTKDGIKLSGVQGCAFKELSFSLKDYNSQAIDQFGMSSLKRDKPEKDNNLANFLFTIKKTKEGFSLEGIEGSTWKNLSFNCSGTCRQFIDQNGMTDGK